MQSFHRTGSIQVSFLPTKLQTASNKKSSFKIAYIFFLADGGQGGNEFVFEIFSKKILLCLYQVNCQVI